MGHVEQLERETEQTRTRIVDTLDELRACMTPGHVLDQLADYLSDGATAAFARNLKDQTVNNPLAVALIGAGVAWLMISPRGSNGSFPRASGDRLQNAGRGAPGNLWGTNRVGDFSVGDFAAGESAERNERSSRVSEGLSSAAQRARQTGADSAGATRDTAASMTGAVHQGADTVRETAGSIADSTGQIANQAADSLRHAASSMSDSMQRTASAGYETIANSARRTADTLSEAGQRTLMSGSAFLDFCHEQPMLLAGLGLAVGAILGALVPTSETEDRLIGEASDRVKDRAHDLASEEVERAKKLGERAIETAKDETVKQQDKSDETGDSSEKEQPAGEVKTESETIPSDESELERKGRPWTAEDAPL